MTASEMKDVLAGAVSGAMAAGFDAGRSSGGWWAGKVIDAAMGWTIEGDGNGPEEALAEVPVEAPAEAPVEAPAEVPSAPPLAIHPPATISPATISPATISPVTPPPPPLPESQPEVSRQRNLVAELSLQIAATSAQLKSLREEFKAQVQILAEMESGEWDPNSSQISGSRTPAAQQTREPGGPRDDRLLPPDPAGNVPVQEAFVVSPGVLEKLAAQDVVTVAQLEAYMRAGRLVPGRVKGIGQIAIDKLTDGLMGYRAKNPVPTWEDVREEEEKEEGEREEKGEAAVESQAEEQAEVSPVPETPEVRPADHPPAQPEQPAEPTETQAPVFITIASIVAALDPDDPLLQDDPADPQPLDEDDEGSSHSFGGQAATESTEEINPSAVSAILESTVDPAHFLNAPATPPPSTDAFAVPRIADDIAGLEEAEEAIERGEDVVLPPESFEPANPTKLTEMRHNPPKAQKGTRTKLKFRDGSDVDMPIYEAGKRAAAELEEVSSNPYRQGTVAWRSWDLGWQEGQ